MTTDTDARTAYTDGLRAVADWLDQHPEVDLPWAGGEFSPLELAVWTSKEQLAAIARALPGPVEKRYNDYDGSGMSTLDLYATFGPIHVRAYAGRSAVCERVVTGKETVTVPAVEAKPEMVEERDIVEWRCHPLLADVEQDEAVTA